MIGATDLATSRGTSCSEKEVQLMKKWILKERIQRENRQPRCIDLVKFHATHLLLSIAFTRQTGEAATHWTGHNFLDLSINSNIVRVPSKPTSAPCVFLRKNGATFVDSDYKLSQRK